jgi:hypothetical protein
MNKLGIIVLGTVLLVSGCLYAADTTTTAYNVFTPTGAGKNVLIKSGARQYNYFVVEKGVSFGFDITGPDKIKIHTRAEFKPGLKDVGYEIQVWEANHLIKGRKVNATPSALTFNNQALGLSRDIIIDVPEGVHKYRLWITSDQADRYYTRFYQTNATVVDNPVNYIQPSQFRQQVTLLSGGNLEAYYIVDTAGGVTLTIDGPVMLTLFCRANFDKNMKGRAKFTLGMYEGDREVTQFAGAVPISSKAAFKELSDLVPSTLNTYGFSVPPGKHIYQFRKINSASPSLAIRFKATKSTTP